MNNIIPEERINTSYRNSFSRDYRKDQGECQDDSISQCPAYSHQMKSSEEISELYCPLAGDPLNLHNMMPALNPNMSSVPSGTSTLRVESSIPRTGSQQTWKYPSPAMFYSAVERKGHHNAISNFNRFPLDLNTTVHIHNLVNEQVWQEILKYEKFHSLEYEDAYKNKSLSSQSSSLPDDKYANGPTLTRFIGRPKDISPKAKLMNFLGYSLPFDRHDWYIDRCGKTVRYVIDFYPGKANSVPNNLTSQNANDKNNPIHEQQPLETSHRFEIPPSIFLDVRPELSWNGVIDRMRMQMLKWMSFLRENI